LLLIFGYSFDERSPEHPSKPDASRELAKTGHLDRFLEPQQKQEAEEKIKTINDSTNLMFIAFLS
jgi:hypothetical protein